VIVAVNGSLESKSSNDPDSPMLRSPCPDALKRQPIKEIKIKRALFFIVNYRSSLVGSVFLIFGIILN
jgi:hypothetical protein